MTAEEIGAATLFTARNVGYIFADYRAFGLEGLEDSRGGRHRENLTLAEEAELLAPFEQDMGLVWGVVRVGLWGYNSVKFALTDEDISFMSG